jgi:protoheme IX farnesyltransferase
MINYYLLLKPGIILGNLITFAAGFILATNGKIDFVLFFSTLLGLSLIIASACVWNNYIDRFVDQKMERTAQRPLATGKITIKKALLFAVVIGLLGNAILYTRSNLLALALADLGFFIYVGLYSFLKNDTSYSTLIGSVSGAIPPLVGYCSVSNQWDLCSSLLFLMMIFWQMPHFFAIGLWRLNDYKNAKIPILPVAKGIYRTKVQMLLYILALFPTLALLTIYEYTGTLFLVATLSVSVIWLFYGIKGFNEEDHTNWGKQMFRISLLLINTISICSMI